MDFLYPHRHLVREAGVEPAASRLSIECSNHAELFPVEPDVRVALTSPAYKAGASPAILPSRTGANVRNPTGVGRLPCDCSVTELHRLEPERRFELRFGRYECPVLPIELVRLERARRIEPR